MMLMWHASVIVGYDMIEEDGGYPMHHSTIHMTPAEQSNNHISKDQSDLNIH